MVEIGTHLICRFSFPEKMSDTCSNGWLQLTDE